MFDDFTDCDGFALLGFSDLYFGLAFLVAGFSGFDGVLWF